MLLVGNSEYSDKYLLPIDINPNKAIPLHETDSRGHKYGRLSSIGSKVREDLTTAIPTSNGNYSLQAGILGLYY